MAKYVLAAPHNPEECLEDLDKMVAEAPDLLNKFVWGCAQGEHKGFAYIEAESKEAVTATIPKSLQGKIKVIEVNKLTPEQIKSFHEK